MTSPIVVAFCISFLVTVVGTPILIPVLKKLKFGQTIREIGPSWHQSKNGTPTMGGIGFAVATLLAGFIVGKADPVVCLALLTCAAFGLIGFADDYIKVVKKRNLGLTEIQKMFFQTAVTVVFLYVASKLQLIDTAVYIPFAAIEMELGFFYYVFAAFLIIGFVNAVNLTDGIDGLATSVTLIFCIFFAVFLKLQGVSGLPVFAAASAGGMLAFLFYNFNPAQVFMGDTGSLFLGGVVSILAVLSGYELLLIPAGVIYWCEALSVILQVAYYKKTKKRLFLMTPIHHHFEKLGWKEKKIVGVFSLITLIGCIVCFFA